VKDYLQQHLTEVEQSNVLEETDKNELYSMYINCLEVWTEFGRKELQMEGITRVIRFTLFSLLCVLFN